MSRVVALVVGLVVTATIAPVSADVVTDWNATTFQIGGPLISRTLSMVHLAMFDAVNSLEHRYRPYHFSFDAPCDASPAAAAAAAAYGVLVRAFPAQKPALDAALAHSLAAVPDGSSKDEGLTLGDRVAAAIVALRQGDGMLVPGPAYVPRDVPGVYQLTPPGFVPPINTGAASWTPFAIPSASAFRPPGPPRLRSRRYAAELEEVRTIGAIDSGLRTPEETLIANWHVPQAFAPLNAIARGGAAGNPDLLANARFFALLNVAMMDAVESLFEAKYYFTFWRPVTAIRAADTDGNPLTAADPGWTPLIVTPPHPEYPSAHSVVSAAGGEILEAFLGRHYSFDIGSANVPGVVRHFDDVDAWVADAGAARIFGGIHFRAAVEDGTAQGRRLGRWVLRHILQPRREQHR